MKTQKEFEFFYHKTLIEAGHRLGKNAEVILEKLQQTSGNNVEEIRQILNVYMPGTEGISKEDLYFAQCFSWAMGNLTPACFYLAEALNGE